MALDVSHIQSTITLPGDGSRAVAAQQAEARPAISPQPGVRTPPDLGALTADLERVSAAFNRRLSFSINEKLGQVVVKVIDADTDKVIKEIPPEELQRVYERIREVIGLLLDEKA